LVNNDQDVADLVANIHQIAVSGTAATKPAAAFRALAERSKDRTLAEST